MLIPHGAVIALVDGQNFELYRNAGNEAEPDLAALDAPKIAPDSHSGAGHKSRAAEHADSLVNEDAHAIAVVEWLNAQVLGHKLEQLFVIAAPRTLGEMRRHYHKQTERALIKEVAKDLIGKKPDAIVEALREHG